ncbi:uncharacterized protein FA14DRAFT_172189 [Meira miltonrushii]|uniref:Endoplasmic reticulum-based factor for assembly of V-ATPase n=1 Tax=Meira miltonrushii TaxID=1280837 RepID=A0A316VD46_9BASI|nr:uncharacterized protein FA14DRAFT_172189 [Meira miltonrushii]PWN35569.1 hypothetical protein FA14DRAFT_172189 [Meira miltonrushii]
MPHLIVSDAVAKQLHDLTKSNKATQSDDRIQRLKDELASPPQPDMKDAYYEKGSTVLSHQCLVDVASLSQDGDNLSLNNLLRGAKVAIPIKPKPERSPALIEALRKIELEQQEKEYAAMMPSQSDKSLSFLDTFRSGGSGKSGYGKDNSNDDEEWAEVRQQISAIINVLVSMVAVAVAVWWAGGTADPIWKTLVAMPLCFLVAIAETFLYWTYWENLKKKKERLRKRK